MEKLRQQISQFASAPFPVLIEGESGSGKEIVAKKSLHLMSNRAARPFLALKLRRRFRPTRRAGTLFGPARVRSPAPPLSRAGYFEDAKDSTLFLDEIGELRSSFRQNCCACSRTASSSAWAKPEPGVERTGSSPPPIVHAPEIRSGNFPCRSLHRLSVFTISVRRVRDLGDDQNNALDHFRDFLRHARRGVKAFASRRKRCAVARLQLSGQCAGACGTSSIRSHQARRAGGKP